MAEVKKAKSEIIIVEWKQPRIRIFQVGMKGSEGQALIDETRSVTLRPGINEITQLQWDANKDRKEITVAIAKGDLVITKATSKQAGLGNMKAVEAIEVIKKTFNKGLLEMWAQDEERTDVLEAIGAQIKFMAEDPNAVPTAESLKDMSRENILLVAKKYGIDRAANTKSEELCKLILEKVSESK